MSNKKDKLETAELRQRNEAEIKSLLETKAEDYRKARFKHALGQLRETHTLRVLRRDIAKLNTALTQRTATAPQAEVKA